MTTEELLFAASLSRTLPEIDLHNADDVHEAMQMLEGFLYDCHTAPVRYGRVIHGKGSGILASQVTSTLSNHPMVQAWQREDHGGACVVVF